MNDAINGAFELGMACMLALSVRKLWREKRVMGWSIASVAWPTAWGIWNLYYYPSLGQVWSFVGGVFVVLANATWIALACVYVRRELHTEFAAHFTTSLDTDDEANPNA